MNNSDSTPSQANFDQSHSVAPSYKYYDLTIRPGQTDFEIKWALHGINRSDADLAAMVYRARLIDYLSRHHPGDNWYDILTPRQQEVMLEGRRCKERREYAKEKGSPVRAYRTGRTDDEKRAEDAERKRRARARGAPSKLKTDLSAMSDEELSEHRRRKARERKQRQREKERLTSSMTPEELAQHELVLERVEAAKIKAIMDTLR